MFLLWVLKKCGLQRPKFILLLHFMGYHRMYYRSSSRQHRCVIIKNNVSIMRNAGKSSVRNTAIPPTTVSPCGVGDV